MEKPWRRASARRTAKSFVSYWRLGGNKGALSHLRRQYETNDFAVRLALALLHGFFNDEHLWKSHGEEQARGARQSRSSRIGVSGGLVPPYCPREFLSR